MKFTRQFDQMDCGPACIRMVASHYGKDYPLSYLRSLSHLTREGVSVAGIRDALGEIGMESATFEMTLEQLREKCPLPAILYWEQKHFVVLYKITRQTVTKKCRFYIANPAYGKYKLDDEGMSEFWLNGGNGVVVAMEPTKEFYNKQPAKEKHSLLRFAQKYVWRYRWELSQSFVGMLLGLLLSLVSPFLTQALVDDGIGLRNMGLILNVMFAQIFLFIGSFSMGLIGSWVSLYMGTRININVLGDYLSKLLRLPMTFFDTKSVGDYQQRLGDHGRLQSFVTGGTLQTFFSLISAPALLFIIGWYSPFILVVYLFLTTLSTLWMSYFFKKRKALDYEQFRVSAENKTKLYELMSGITDIKLNAYDDYKLNEWHEMQEKQYRMSQKALRLGQIQNTGYTMIGQLRNIIITCWIAAEVVEGNLTLGMMMSISAIIGQVNGPLSQLVSFLQQFQDAKISLERSEEVHLCKDEDCENALHLPDDEPKDIIIRNLTFSYTGRIGKPVLKDISFDIPAGKMTAIVGESGSGKTTLMKLLLKFYEPTTGKILIGGIDLNNYSAKSVRQMSGIVMQDNFVFSDTVKNNIILGEEYDDKKLQLSIDASCLSDYINSQPLGVETKIGSDGVGVSGGEKQRIMIARAIYKNPQYMMLDEATSSLDAENERRITENLDKIFVERTRVVIAHRLSTVKDADNIVVLKHGTVVESGTHSELVAKKGYYYQLVHNQLELAD